MKNHIVSFKRRLRFRQYRKKCLSDALRRRRIIAEMATDQGDFGDFHFFTISDEFTGHRPHIHVCVNKNSSKYKEAKYLNDSYKTLFTVTLKPDINYEYTREDLIIEESYISEKKLTNEMKDACVRWLNSNAPLSNARNSVCCLSSYLRNNNVVLFKEEYKEILIILGKYNESTENCILKNKTSKNRQVKEQKKFSKKQVKSLNCQKYSRDNQFKDSSFS